MGLIDADKFLSKLDSDEYYHTNEIRAMVADTLAASNDPLTLEELREMEGEPVWVERRDSAPILRWAIVGDFKSLYGVYFGTALGGLRLPYEEYGKTWLAYRHRPEGGDSNA